MLANMCSRRLEQMIFLMYVFFIMLYTFLASGDFCHLMIIIANRLDPDQDQQSVGPDLEPNGLIL